MSLFYVYSKGFPGSQPVSMDINNLALLKDRAYKISWKADGTRYSLNLSKNHGTIFLPTKTRKNKLNIHITF